MRRARPRRRVWGGAAVLLLIIGAALAAPVIAGDPITPDVEHGLDARGAPRPPSAARWLGTDALGRDVWARLWFGARRSLAIGGAATALGCALGVGVGLVAASRGGATDAVAMRAIDATLGVPALLVAALAAAALRAAHVDDAVAVVATLTVLGWTTMARVVRAQAQLVYRSDYVLAARALGASPRRVLVRHVLPALTGVIAALSAMALATNLVLEAGLGFVGLGAAPPHPSLGAMLADGQPYLRDAPWLVLAPGLAMVCTVAACNLLGDGLRAANEADVPA